MPALRSALLFATAALLLAGCSKPPWPEGPATTDAEREADSIWQQRCLTCHGAEGRGDGPTAKTLKTKPQDFTDRAWQKDEPDGEIELAILLGGEAAGHSKEMPANPDLGSKPEVVKSLVKRVRHFGR